VAPETLLRAIVGVCLEADKSVESVSVDCFGAEEMLPHLPSVTIDKLLIDLCDNKKQQAELFDRFERMLENAVATSPSRATFGVPLVDPTPGKPDVTLKIEMSWIYEKGRLGATTKPKPQFRSPLRYEALADIALCSVWDKTMTRLSDPDYEAILSNLGFQRDEYSMSGLPGVRDVGKAPHYAAMKGSADRLAADVAAGSGLTLEEFRALPDEERGEIYAQSTEAHLDALRPESDAGLIAENGRSEGSRECLNCGALSAEDATYCYKCRQPL
jgi:hypothetical protein